MSDTNTIPTELKAPWLKRFFKEKLGIPVRVKGGRSSYLNVWIPSDRDETNRHRLVYHHEFPEILGNRCMRAVYPNSASLSAQNWGGNVTRYSIAMGREQWRKVLQSLIDDPIEVNA